MEKQISAYMEFNQMPISKVCIISKDEERDLSVCEDYAKRQGWQISDIIRYRNATEKMTCFCEAKGLVEDSRIDAVLVRSISVISRDIQQFNRIIRWFFKHGIRVIAADAGPLDTNQMQSSVLSILSSALYEYMKEHEDEFSDDVDGEDWKADGEVE